VLMWFIYSSIFVLAFVVCGSAINVPKKRFEIELSQNDEMETPWLITVTLTALEDVTIHPFNSPFDESFACKHFQVKGKNGNLLKNYAPMVKRVPPKDEDYLTIQTGEQHVKEVDLSACFSFKPGIEYQIYIESKITTKKDDKVDKIALNAPALTFQTDKETIHPRVSIIHIY